MRFAGILSACLFGIGVPGFLLGPVLFDGVSLDAISTSAFAGAIACGVLGVWLLLVSSLAPVEDVRKVLESFQASEAVLLFLPYILVVGSRSIWRRIVEGNDVQRVNR